MAFVFNAGGIGDYINWVPAIRAAINSAPHLSGYVLTPEYFADLAHLWFDGFSDRFLVSTYRDLETEPLLDTHNAIVPNRGQFANACGFHLMHLGFIYFTQRNLVPADVAILPEIRGDETDVSRFGLPHNYVVITTEATAKNRQLPAEVINEVTQELLNRGLIPVFLGRRSVANGYVAQSDDGIDLTGVVDLREKTTLVEAAVILAQSRLVIGLDNGLLHLAACSLVPLVCIFTSVDPKLREPRRRAGARTAIITPSEYLTCRFCNSRMTHLIGHDFKNCIYGDNLCTKSIGASIIIQEATRLLEETT